MVNNTMEPIVDNRRSNGLIVWEQYAAKKQPLDDGDIFIFGYGSLIWKVAFPRAPVERVVGKISGWKRRFWQGSTDHRGVPGMPGRVCTLIEDAESETWGVAYRVSAAHVREVLEYLDEREKGGYTCHEVEFHPRAHYNRSSHTTFVYCGTPDNEDYIGPQPKEELADIIASSIGPSGPNKDYLLHLASAIREIAPESVEEDGHLFGLERLVLERLQHTGTVNH
ncbi:hypothetical protein SARC_08291 [Sphaeroforma arctica JP610]|uniref:glutathione-specific gamma-glutamylcyclotransferase n=1 Tax=Sphaeroforma arctica JP610 TaxID=667725 RepID=A0A0L0FTQ0_9EUKA|nr:hypothetical protein SARC_08291 [Sphaeroforma arctica JP610]KNC79308.1 hypothetical protein SARC_08291 [Sphaeroforma arctica JP610]|eukprot:XP_014153210.1 hypothetical protein SARC_08291 [Sphaeroforma arctica JP610]